MSVLAGGGPFPYDVAGLVNGGGVEALFNEPQGLSYAEAGFLGILFVGDTKNNVIRAVDIGNEDAVVTVAGGRTLDAAGFADGDAVATALFTNPIGVAAVTVPPYYVYIFIADSGNNRIRLFNAVLSEVSTVAGGGGEFGTVAGFTDATGTNALFDTPTGVAADSTGQNVYVADRQNNCIRAIASALNTSGGVVTTLAGSSTPGNADGVGAAATFNRPSGVALGIAGTVLYVADSGSNLIRNITIATGLVLTVAGGSAGRADGIGAAAAFYSPLSLAIDTNLTDVLYVADAGNNLVRIVQLSTQMVTTCAGGGSANGNAAGRADAIGSSALFSTAVGVTYSPGTLYVADSAGASVSNNLLRRISDPSTNPNVSVVAGGGELPISYGYEDAQGTSALMNAPQGVSFGPNNTYFFADAVNNRVRAVDVVSGAVTTVAGSGDAGYADGIGTAAMFKLYDNVTGYVGGATAVDCAGSLFVADSYNGVIRVIALASGAVSTLAGDVNSIGHADGVGTAASFYTPVGVATDCAGHVYVVDLDNLNVRTIDIATTNVTTLAGDASAPAGFVNGVGLLASFNHPNGIAWKAGWLFIGDSDNNAIRIIDISSANVSTLAGGGPGYAGSSDGIGTSAQFAYPIGVAADDRGNVVVADYGNNLIRSIEIATQTTKTLAGSLIGFADGLGTAAQFNGPVGVALTPSGTIIATDSINNLLRTLALPVYV